MGFTIRFETRDLKYEVCIPVQIDINTVALGRFSEISCVISVRSLLLVERTQNKLFCMAQFSLELTMRTI